MDTERNLLFGVVAFQNGVVDADSLAATCADWVAEPTLPLADLLVDRGLLTVEQRTEVEKAVEHELNAHGNDSQATLAATLDSRSIEAIGEAAGSSDKLDAKLELSPAQSSHVVLGTLSTGEQEGRERYSLTHLHAKGGMGRVWLARDTSLGRQIALKELRPDQTNNSIVCSRFLYEAKITAQLEHPGIVPVYELGEGHIPYYTMRFVKGRTLSEAIRAFHKKRAVGEATTIEHVELLTAFVGVCHAVAYAHSRGIIHRDLKGQNIVLGNFGEVMVLDWGLAKRIGPDQERERPAIDGDSGVGAPGAAPVLDAELAALGTGASVDAQNNARPLLDACDLQVSPASNGGSSPGTNSSRGHGVDPSSNGGTGHRSGSGRARQTNRESGAGPEGTMQGQLLGTPAYMAPEQAQGRHDLVDERTDVYGLGAILYEVLTGRPPFIGPKTSEIIRKVCQDAPTPPRQIVETITPGMEAVCLRALSKIPADRYASASELAQEIQRDMADEPVKAYPEPWITRMQRWARRHKTAVTSVACLLVTATILSAIGLALVNNERKEAEAQGQQARQAVQLLTKVADIGFDEQLDPLQTEFLEDALRYYEQFTSRLAHDPGVRLEHGRVYQQMGDILRKLGKSKESDQAYRKAIEVLQPLALAPRARPEIKRSLARTQTLLGDLLVRHGDRKEQAEELYGQALQTQQVLATTPAAPTEDRLRLGQTVKSQGDLLRLNGKWTAAGPAYDKAIAIFEEALKSDAKQPEWRNDLAWAIDARGWVHRELGEFKPAERAYQRAVKLLEDLVKEFPTVPRHREALARAYNSLALIEQSDGRLAEAEAHFQLELPLVDRLASDFPTRLEYSRELARTLMNLGNVMSILNHRDDAERALRRTIEVHSKIAAQDRHDVLIQLDLAKAHTNLGELLRKGGDIEGAIASYERSHAISWKLVKEHPDQPRYSEQLARNLGNLALAQSLSAVTRAQETFQAGIAIYEKLVAEHRENFDYRLGLAISLQNFGQVLAEANQTDHAETVFAKALTLLDTKDSHAQSLESLRVQSTVLVNLGSMREDLNRPDAEEALRRALAIAENLIARSTAAGTDEHNRAIAKHNLGDWLLKQRRLPEAQALLASSSSDLERLVAAAPKSIELQSHCGMALETQAKWFDVSGKPAEAKNVLASAIEHQRRAVQLGQNQYAYRELLASHLLELAKVDLELGAYEEAGRLVLDVPKTVPNSKRAQACFDSARVLARLVTLAGGDVKVAQTDRDRLTRNYLGRAVVFLREAIDSSPTLVGKVKVDPDIKQLETRPEFRTIMNTLVNLGL